MNQDFLAEKGLHFKSQERGKTYFQTILVFENEIEVRAFPGQKQMPKAKTLIHCIWAVGLVGQNDFVNPVGFIKINLSSSCVFTEKIETGVSYYVAAKKPMDPRQLRITGIFAKWWQCASFELYAMKQTVCKIESSVPGNPPLRKYPGRCVQPHERQ